MQKNITRLLMVFVILFSFTKFAKLLEIFLKPEWDSGYLL